MIGTFKIIDQKEYNTLTENEQAHYDACVDHHTEEQIPVGQCVCGVIDCAEAYDHTTHGF